ncbi:hypothetical protein BV25DRAFT_155728 [Artomyces pyxidatus]|uniref:Uncharacterized protein n=1 Tax=Artomyces pyxidatus TaxID=48021 RepID=A0ACB8T9Q5_9AGAM|nr:hypothetical protein BV25DRAFT_155728 [Artomyces pyxidatus]
MRTFVRSYISRLHLVAPFGDAYEKIGTIQRRLAWPLHKDDTLFQSGRPTGLNIYFVAIPSNTRPVYLLPADSINLRRNHNAHGFLSLAIGTSFFGR